VLIDVLTKHGIKRSTTEATEIIEKIIKTKDEIF